MHRLWSNNPDFPHERKPLKPLVRIKMRSKAVRKMIETETLQLSKWQWFWHFSVVPLLMIVPVVTTFNLAKDLLSGSYVYKTYQSELFLYGYIWVLPAIGFYFLQLKRLRFTTIIITVDKDVFQHAVRETAKELGWRILKKTNTLIVAQSEFSWRSWGELITIIREKDRILFNSICDPENRPSIASYGMNRLNRKVFEQYLRQISTNTNVASMQANQ